jgi:hypothetical protein
MGCKLTDKDLLNEDREHPAKATTEIRRAHFLKLLTEQGGFEVMGRHLDRLAPLIAELVALANTKAEAAGLVAALTHLAASSAFSLVGTDEDPGVHHCNELAGLAASFFDTLAALHLGVVEDMQRDGEPVDSVSEARARIAPPQNPARVQCGECQHRDQCPSKDVRKHIIQMAHAERAVKHAAEHAPKTNDVAARAERSVDELLRAINARGGAA